MSRPEIPGLPPGQFYIGQLQGCQVVTEEGTDVGVFLRAEDGPAHDLWVVGAGGREQLIPAVAEIVVRVDTEARLIVIRPPAGLLEL